MTPDTNAEPFAAEWDETAVALNLIGQLVERHPDWRVTSQTGEDGNIYTMIQFPDSGDFNGQAESEFIKMVSELGGSDE